MKNSIFYLFVCISINVNAQKFEEQVITVEPYLSFQNYEHFTRLVLEANDPQVEFITGFDFEWGFRYTLKVNVETLEPMLSDGTRFEYELLEELAKVQVPDTFEFKLFLGRELYYGEDLEVSNFKALNDSTFLYFEEVEIEVPELYRDKFNKIVDGSSHGKVGRFTGINEKRIRLVRL